MWKQVAVISLSAITLLLVWGIVIFELFETKQNAHIVREAPKVERAAYEKENEDIRLPERPKNDAIKPAGNQNNIAIKDLRLIDFSDVSTPAGVSIDDILSRLKLN